MAGKMSKAVLKKSENTKRLRYIRVLERFVQSITNYLFKVEEPGREVYDKKVDNNVAYLRRVEKVPLYKGEFSDMEALVEHMIALRNSEESIETIKEDLLYRNNQIEKSMNRRNYKKDKHVGDKFKEWD